MEIGGNKRAMEFYKKHNMFKDGNPHHEHASLTIYKSQLQNEALKLLEGFEVQAPKEALPV